MIRSFRFFYILLWPVVHLLFPLRVRHRERLPEGAKVLCAPHSNLIDPILLMIGLGMRCFPRFMAKKELFEKPVLGAFLRSVGVFPVSRGSADMTAVKTALGILKEGGTIGIFPEGTRIHADESGSAKAGAVMLASRTGAPIVPIWLPRDKKPFRKVEIVIGEPYELPRLRGGTEVYQPHADELMRRIGQLGGAAACG